MEHILDSVRKIILRWTKTQTSVTSDINKGDTVINVVSNGRFWAGDSVIIRDSSQAEVGLVVESVNIYSNPTQLILSSSTPARFNWSLSKNPVVERTVHDMFVKGIYIGDPDVIPEYPAITVNGTSSSQEWFTIGSTKKRFEVDINVFVLESSHEKGLRFLYKMVALIEKGLHRNIFPLVDDYSLTYLVESAEANDTFVKIDDVTLFTPGLRVIFENSNFSQENLVVAVYPDELINGGKGGVIRISDPLCQDFSMLDTSVISPNIFVFNSLVTGVDYGKIHKRELLKAGTIKWFAEIQEIQNLIKFDTRLK